MKKFYTVPAAVIILQTALIGTYNAHATIGSKLGRAVSSVLGRVEFGKGNYNLKDNLNIPSNLKKQTKQLIKEGYITGVESDNFNFDQLNKLTMDYLYHQYFDKEGKLITLISKKLPVIRSIDKTEVKTTYVDENNEDRVLTTSGIPRWLIGIDIYHDEKKLEKSKEQVGKNITERSNLLLHAEENVSSNNNDEYYLGDIVKARKSSPHFVKDMLTESDSDGEETVELLTGKENKQKENDYKALVGKGLTNYGFEDK